MTDVHVVENEQEADRLHGYWYAFASFTHDDKLIVTVMDSTEVLDGLDVDRIMFSDRARAHPEFGKIYGELRRKQLRTLNRDRSAGDVPLS